MLHGHEQLLQAKKKGENVLKVFLSFMFGIVHNSRHCVQKFVIVILERRLQKAF